MCCVILDYSSDILLNKLINKIYCNTTHFHPN